MGTLHELSDRDRIRKIVNDYAVLKNKERGAIYNILYSALENAIFSRYKSKVVLDLAEVAREKGISRLEYIEQIELMQDTLVIARDIFREVCRDGKETSFFAETGS